MSEGKMNRKSTSVVLRDDQSVWIKKNHINLSQYVRYLIDEGVHNRDLGYKVDKKESRELFTDEDKARLDFCQILLDRFERSTVKELLESKEMMITSNTLKSKQGQNDMSTFCKGLITKFQLLDMRELNTLIYDGEIEIVDHRME